MNEVSTSKVNEKADSSYQILIDEPQINQESKALGTVSMKQSPSFRKMESLDTEGNFSKSSKVFPKFNSADHSPTISEGGEGDS